MRHIPARQEEVRSVPRLTCPHRNRPGRPVQGLVALLRARQYDLCVVMAGTNDIGWAHRDDRMNDETARAC